MVAEYPGHAFGHLTLAWAYDGLGYLEAAAELRQRFAEIIAYDTWWREQSEKYGLSVGGPQPATDALIGANDAA